MDAAMCTKLLGEPTLVEVPGWTHDVPSQTSRALLRLLCIHVIHLSMAAEVVLKSGRVQFCTCFDETERTTVMSAGTCKTFGIVLYTAM